MSQALDTRGVIYAVQIAIYVPVMFFALRICSRYGVRERGWLFLLIFSLIRIVNGALVVALEQPFAFELPGYSYSDINQAAGILDSSGISFLLLSTLGLMEIITEGPSGERKHWHTIVFRVLHFVGIAALVLIIFGMSYPWVYGNPGGVTMVHIGVLLLAGLFIVLVAVIVLQWASRYRLMKYRKQLLVAVTVALPFLAVRTLYSVLSAFSYTDYIGFDTSNSLAKFNQENLPLTGEWQIYVFMEVVMEYAVVVIYASAGTVLRLDEDYAMQGSD